MPEARLWCMMYDGDEKTSSIVDDEMIDFLMFQEDLDLWFVVVRYWYVMRTVNTLNKKWSRLECDKKRTTKVARAAAAEAEKNDIKKQQQKKRQQTTNNKPFISIL